MMGILIGSYVLITVLIIYKNYLDYLYQKLVKQNYYCLHCIDGETVA